MKVVMHHPELKESTREVDARAFKVVWEPIGWVEGPWKKPAKKTSSKKTTSGDDS